MVRERPIVSQPEFVLASRDTGYRSLAAAVAELIDNSIQAHATHIRVQVRGPDEDAGISTPLIAVWDNGVGMEPESLAMSVQFGGTERFNDRTGLGRFGMGLPNSSVSVARRVDVFTWQRRGEVWHTYLDIDEVATEMRATVPAPVKDALPAWISAPNTPSGTLVLWSRCDRLDLRRPSAICNRLRRPLGRIYRQRLWQGLRVRINGEPLEPHDPMFCRTDTGQGGGVPYGEELRYELVAPRSGTTAYVNVRFTELPVVEWHAMSNDDKRAAGISGGAGVSFMRAGREIDYGWHLMGTKRKENYDDWWRCEVSFSPELDEYFGVTHSKQGVTPTTHIRSVLEPDMEAIARRLNSRVRSTFASLLRDSVSRATLQATRQDRLLPALRGRREVTPATRAGLSYRISARPIAGREFLAVTIDHGQVNIDLNEDHPFYKNLYAPLGRFSVEGRFAVECVLIAAARAALCTPEAERTQYIERWSDVLAAFLDGRGIKS
jgi:anti-sigma regulatory factor (Ser/Thr protein kinase)